MTKALTVKVLLCVLNVNEGFTMSVQVYRKDGLGIRLKHVINMAFNVLL